MKSPAITATVYGRNKTLYLQVTCTYCIFTVRIISYNLSVFDHTLFNFQSVTSIEERTRPNLSKTLKGNVKYYYEIVW